MTENEAIKILERQYKSISMCTNVEKCHKHNEAILMAVDALTEIQKYRKNSEKVVQ